MNEPQREDELVRLNVAARALGVSTQTVKKYCRCKLLRCARTSGGHWRVYRSAVDAVLAERGPRIPSSEGVYFVKCGDFIKVGRSMDVRSRLASAQSFIPWRLELLHVHRCDDVGRAEREAHEALAVYRHRREWFYDIKPVRDYIDRLRQTGPNGIGDPRPSQ